MGMVQYKHIQNTQDKVKVLPPRTQEDIVHRERREKQGPPCLWPYQKIILLKFPRRLNAKEDVGAIKSRFGGNDESKKMQKYILKATLLSLRTPATLMKLVSLIVFPIFSGPKHKYEQTSSYSLLLNNQVCPSTGCIEDLEQIDEYDLEEMDLKWPVAMILNENEKVLQETEMKNQGTPRQQGRRDSWNSGNKIEQNFSDSDIIGGLACLIAKATTNESNKWHRSGYVKFTKPKQTCEGKPLRGLPPKDFSNDHNIVLLVRKESNTRHVLKAPKQLLVLSTMAFFILQQTHPDFMTDEKRFGPREENKSFMDELERLKRQEKEANDEAEALRKMLSTKEKRRSCYT
ncbi:hypothetical protein Tco_1474802 [Tanacetum coccineum]